MGTGTEICIVCAWRQSCQKKFSLSGKDMRCADFVKDISIPSVQPDEKENSSPGADAGEKE